MLWNCSLLVGGVAVGISGLGLLHGEVASQGIDSFIRKLSPGITRMELRISEIEEELKSMPRLAERTWGSRYGHRSGDLPNSTQADWLQLDYGRNESIETVVLVPALLSFRGEDGVGYGFPKRFRVEVSQHSDMRDSVVVVDRSREDVANPGRNPMVFQVGPVEGRYLRFTSLKHVEEEGVHFWAMEELMAISGNYRLIRASGEHSASYSTGLDLFPQWVPVRIADGQSALGMPVDMTQKSPSQGFLSATHEVSDEDESSPPGHQSYCGVDLGQAEVIDQVNLLPIESDDYQVIGGRGFPRAFVVQLSNDPEFRELVWEEPRGDLPLGFPSSWGYTIGIPQVTARYVRVLVKRMWQRDKKEVFGLAELQVYGRNRNLALGQPVFVSSQADGSNGSNWDPAFLVDGFTSRYRLVEWPEYLERLDCKAALDHELAQLSQQRVDRLFWGRRLMAAVGVVLGITLVVGWLWMLVWQRVSRRRTVEELRQQIARDLHDDIGSNLGGIVLLSELGSQHSQDPESRNDFESIRQAAEGASVSMRDIVWLIQREPVGLKDLVTRMRQSVRMMLTHLEVTVEVEPATFRDRSLSLLFRRHVFLAFKEVLNNVRKHAHTGRVEVQVDIDASRLRFRVRDEGVGFDPVGADVSGYGLGNLKRRASRVGGKIQIESAPGKGTVVIFEAPFST